VKLWGLSPGRRGPSPEARRKELVLREELVQRPRHDDRNLQGSWRHDWESPLMQSRPEQSGAADTTVSKMKKNNKRKKGSGGGVGRNQSGFPPTPPRAPRSQEESPVNMPTTNTYFNCGVVGHFRSDYTEPEQCILCGDVSHLAVMYTARYRRKDRETLEFLGHGIDGGFYYLESGCRAVGSTAPRSHHCPTLPPRTLPWSLRLRLISSAMSSDTSPMYL
jgi:hypothetical protein